MPSCPAWAVAAEVVDHRCCPIVPTVRCAGLARARPIRFWIPTKSRPQLLWVRGRIPESRAWCGLGIVTVIVIAASEMDGAGVLDAMLGTLKFATLGIVKTHACRIERLYESHFASQAGINLFSNFSEPLPPPA
jgi:hypothetical protein